MSDGGRGRGGEGERGSENLYTLLVNEQSCWDKLSLVHMSEHAHNLLKFLETVLSHQT